MNEENIFESFFRRAINCFKQANVDYVVVGGTTLPYFGHYRATQDIDIMVSNNTESKLQQLVQCLQRNKISVTVEEIVVGFAEGMHVSAFDASSWIFRLDLKQITTDFDILTYNNALQVELNNVSCKISCPESIIAIKISSGFQSTTDLEDILSIIELNNLNVRLLYKFLDTQHSLGNMLQFLAQCNTENCEKLHDHLLKLKQ